MPDAYRRQRLFGTLCVALVCMVVPSASAFAAPSMGDREATRRWAVARSTEQQILAKVLPAGAAAAEHVVDGIEANCPDALGDAAANLPGKDKLVAEAVEDVSLAAEASTRPAVEQFVNAVRPLRWSNRGLDHIAGLSADAQSRRFALVPTNFCADVAYWKAHDYQLAPATMEFRQALENASRRVSEPGWLERIEIQLRLLGDKHEKRLLRRIRVTEWHEREVPRDGSAARLAAVVGFQYATPL